MFDQIFFFFFFSPQVTRSVIISNKNGIYKLPHKFAKRLKAQDLRKLGTTKKISKFIELQLSTQSSQKMNFFFQHQQGTAEKQKLNFSRSALFHMKTGVCLKYFVQGCILKKFFASNSPQAPLSLIWMTILINVRTLTQFYFKLKAPNFQKGPKIFLT